MKFLLSLFLLVGVAWCNSTSYYAWRPNKEYVYRYESQVLSGLPNIRETQWAGARLTSDVRVQTFPDYSLRVKFENVRFISLNGEVRLSESGRIVKKSQSDVEEQLDLNEAEIPSEVKMYLEKPFLVHIKRGVVESFYVDRSEPSYVTNVKKSFLSEIQMDISGSRRSQIESNHVEINNGLERSEVESPLESLEGITYFTTREESLLGDCQTSYTIHELPESKAIQLEQQWKEDLKNLEMRDSRHSEGEEVCRGKKYFQVTKNKNFDNCLKRPVYQKWIGLESKCDTSKTGCLDLFTQMASTSYIVCGEKNDFVIRKTMGENTIVTSPLTWNTEEKMKNFALITIELLREESIRSPMDMPSNTKEQKTLVFEFPETIRKGQRQYQESQQLSLEEREEEMKRTGFYSFLPKPTLRSSPGLMIHPELTKEEVSRQTVELLKKISVEVFETPESCSSKSDVAGHMAAISKYLVPLNYEELKHVENEVLEFLKSKPEEVRKSIKSLFYDVISNVGTNPAVMLIKDIIEEQKVTGHNAIILVQNTLKNIRTPTEEILKELVELVKKMKQFHWSEEMVGSTTKDLYTTGLVHLSNLLYRACVHPVYSVTEYPVRIFGRFCSNESSVITQEWIPYLERELESGSEHDEHFRLVTISSLGKLGHIKSLTPLLKIISGEITTKPLVRSVAVYSLKRIGRLNPSLIKPVLLALIDNLAENVQTRIAAVSVFPWCQPTFAELQKIAGRSWFEPSKQVSCFVYSTYKSLSETEVPELKTVGDKATIVMKLMKPFQCGVQFSQNINVGKFVNYLKSAVSRKFSWVFTEDDVVPNKISASSNIYNPSWVMRGLSFSVYTQGMDYLIEKYLSFSTERNPASQHVRDQLEKITQELRISEQIEKPVEAFFQARMMGYERMFTLNKEYFVEFLNKVTENLRSRPQEFVEGKHFEYTHHLKGIDLLDVAPTSAGFLVYSEKTMPIVFSIKGVFKAELSSETSLPIPSLVEARIMPVFNAKMQSHIGVISPFTSEFIGTGVDAAVHFSSPIETKIQINSMGQVSLTMKTPESLRKEVELFHVYVKPYTFRKDLRTIRPVFKSKDVKIVYSGEELKKYHTSLRSFGIGGMLYAESDNKFTDLYSYWRSIKEHNLASIWSLGLLPSTVRYSSTRLEYNPSESEVKEIVLRFSLTKALKMVENNEVQFEYPESYSDEYVIKKVCKETFPRSESKYESCKVQLSALEEVSIDAKRNCQRHSFHNPEERDRCYKTADICERAVRICERIPSLKSEKCMDIKKTCYQRIVSSHRTKEILSKMGHQSQVRSIQMETELKGPQYSKSVACSLHLGAKDEEYGRYIKTYASIELETPERSIYEIVFDGETKFPFIGHRWNKEKLLDEETKLEFDGKLMYGIRDRNVREIVMKAVMEKTREQKEAIRRSPEYERCSKEEREDWILSPICMKVRHEAASIDRFDWTIQFPQELNKCTLVQSVKEVLKTYLWSQMYYEGESSLSSERELRMVWNFNHRGNEAQLEVQHQGTKWSIRNIRLPETLYGIFPLSLRNNVVDRMVQKLTHNQTPASCRIEPNYIGTFDNKTYSYEINDCMHLLFKDCSGKLPVAVLAKSMAGRTERLSTKIVKILSGLTEIELKPKSMSGPNGLTVLLKVKSEEPKNIELTPGKIYRERNPETGKPLLEVKMYHDKVYRVYFYNENLQVFTDGVRIEVVAPQIVRSRSCGLCGDLNGENTADLKTPGQCLMKKDRLFAYSYMLNKDGSKCNGIPSSDRSEYERESRECVKKHEIITPLKEMYHRLYTLSKPLISVHQIEKQSNQICISLEKVKVCSMPAVSSQSERVFLQGSKPSEMKQKEIRFVCLSNPSNKAMSLEKRARSGEELQTELVKFPVTFTKVVYEPITCKN